MAEKKAFYILNFTLLFLCFQSLNAQTADSKGTDFWIALHENGNGNDGSSIKLFISGDENTTGSVSGAGLYGNQTFTVVPGTTTTLSLSISSQFGESSNIVGNKGIHITTGKAVSVYCLDGGDYSTLTEAYLALPTDVLGTNYINLSYKNVYNSGRASEFYLVATADSTSVTIIPTVTITPTVFGPTRTAYMPFTITLNQGQTYLLATGLTSKDLSGSIISSTKPIAVFGSNSCASIPNASTYYCGRIVEELPPVNSWGKHFATVPLKTRLKGDTFRFLASQNGTSVSVNDSVVVILNQGELYETILTKASQITSTKPILVAQYSNGRSFDNVSADPFMMLIPPYEQFLKDYNIFSIGLPFSTRHFINIVAPNAAIGSIMLDGAFIPSSSFSAIGSSGFSGAAIDLFPGTHNLHNLNFPFGVFVYGLNFGDSYGYPGGQALTKAGDIAKLFVKLLPGTIALAGSQYCLTAAKKDSNGDPLAGVRVNFNITGVNARAGFANTDSNGIATFCYTGLNEGTDHVTASVGSFSDAADVVWSVNFYSKSTGSLTDLSTWGLNPDGSGAVPANFGTGKVFTLANRPSYVLNGDWTIGGTLRILSIVQLKLNGHTLTEAGVNGTGTITGSGTSNLIINGSGGDAGTHYFAGTTLNNLTLNRTGPSPSATIGSAVNVSGVLTVTSGALKTNDNLTLKSSLTNTARVAPIPAAGSVSGYVSVERYIPPRKAWRLMCAPIAGTQTINSAWQEGVTSGNPAPGYGTQITGSPYGGNGFDLDPPGEASIKYYNTAGSSQANTWQPIPNSNRIRVNIAFMIFIAGDRTLNPTDTIHPATPTTLRAKGPLKTGDQPFNVVPFGHNVIPNPFASPINLATITRNNVQNSFYLWDPKLGGPNGVGGYVNVSFNGSTYDITPAVSPESQYIQSGQGFMVHTISSLQGSIVIKESDKSATTANNVFKSTNNGQTLRINLQVVEKNGSGSVADEVLTSYNPDFSNAIDELDVIKLDNFEESLSIERRRQKLMVERRSPIQANDTMYLQLNKTRNRDYLLEFNPHLLSSIASASLEDSYLHTSTAISLNSVTSHRFSVTKEAASKKSDRFKLILLPKNSNPLSPEITGNGFKAYPNPVSGRSFNIDFEDKTKGKYNVELVNSLGMVVFKRTIVHEGGSSVKTIQLNTRLAKGVYQLRIFGDGKENTIKLLSN